MRPQSSCMWYGIWRNGLQIKILCGPICLLCLLTWPVSIESRNVFHFAAGILGFARRLLVAGSFLFVLSGVLEAAHAQPKYLQWNWYENDGETLPYLINKGFSVVS